MPIMNGLETVKYLNQNYKDVTLAPAGMKMH